VAERPDARSPGGASVPNAAAAGALGEVVKEGCLDRETHEMDERRERLSCVSCLFAPFVFQMLLQRAFRGEL